jgi:hypothetical protein
MLLVFLAMLLAACSSAEEQAPVEEEQAPAEEEAAVEETITEETTTEETTEPTEESAQVTAEVTVTRLLSEDEKAAVLACQIEKAERDGYDVQAALQEAINSDMLLTDVLKEDGYTCTVEEALEMARQAEAAQAVPQPEQLPAPRPPNASEKADMCAQGISEACYSHEPQPRKSMSEKTPEERTPVVEQGVNENPAVCNPQSNLSPAERAKYC